MPLKKALQRISRYGYFDEETALAEARKKGELFKRKKTETLSGEKIHFISPEDLILSRLQWYEKSYSSRHLEDIEAVFKISGKKLDKAYLKKWAKNLDIFVCSNHGFN